jgi:holo-[acyl-carrier protein] synthase
MVRGVGIDIVEVPRIERAVARWGEAFLARVFTDRERAHAASAPGAVQRLAGRFAAKEAVMKALGLGWRRMGWRDIEIGTDPLGKPVVVLRGEAAALASQLGITQWLVSISHTRQLAVAHVLAQ